MRSLKRVSRNCGERASDFFQHYFLRPADSLNEKTSQEDETGEGRSDWEKETGRKNEREKKERNRDEREVLSRSQQINERAPRRAWRTGKEKETARK